MEFSKLEKRAIIVRDLYTKFEIKNSGKPWELSQRVSGLEGDVRDLRKIIDSKDNFEGDFNSALSHELSDVLWATIVISEETGVNLEQAFIRTMDELEKRLKKEI